jgi:hypothetical protein
MSKEKENKEKEADEKQQDSGPVSDFEKDGWKEQSDGEVVKLEPGESITGKLVDKSISHKYNDCGIYKLKQDDNPVPKVILGSKQLDRVMAAIEVDTLVKIVFEGTTPSDKGNAMKVFKVYTKE